MIREKMINKKVGAEKHFVWRSHEPVRLEGFSDAVFAFAVTLLIVSLEVPKTFDDLLVTMRGFLAFGLSFAALILIWYKQYIFFRRYALNDGIVFTLNALLIFVVLFYIYPLKFLATFLVNIPLSLIGWGRIEDSLNMIKPEQTPLLMIIYSIGYLLVFVVVMLLHLHAYKKKGSLELSKPEILITQSEIRGAIINVSIAFISILLASIESIQLVAWAGWIYFLVGPALALNGIYMGKKVKLLVEEAK